MWPPADSSGDSGALWRPRANTPVVVGGGDHRDFSRNSAACAHLPGAVFDDGGTRMWVPPVGPSCVHEACSVGRVPRAAQHAGVGGIEWSATIDERQHVVERQVTRWMGRMIDTIAWADVAVLADVAGDHPLGQASPSRVRMDVVVGTDSRQRRVLAAPTPRAAGNHTADRAELHRRPAGDLAACLTLVTLDCGLVDIATSVGRVRAAVYPPAVLRLRDQPADGRLLDGVSRDPDRLGHGTFDDPYFASGL
jgi:hypothetical protein